ncbi:MAG: galactokinase [Bdellovibrionales bacterium]
MESVKVTSPTRVDLAGGTLDLWPIYNFLDKPVTINLAIDVFSNADLKVRSDKKVILDSKDLNKSVEYENIDACLADEECELVLLQEVVRFYEPNMGFHLSTWSESPVGAGLGGSSSLCISIMRAFEKSLGLELEVNELVNAAHNIESRLLKTPTGTQDYFPPRLGGALALHYKKNKIYTETLDLPKEILANHLVLVYTGRPHHSGLNNWQVLKSLIDGDEKTLDCLKKLNEVSKDLLETIRAKQWQNITELFKREYQHRVALSSVFTSPEIERLASETQAKGASAIKICGAGGGGCVLLWCQDPISKPAVEQQVEQMGFKILPF